jgi:hypothetical protein
LGYGDVTPVERWRLLGPMNERRAAVRQVDRSHLEVLRRTLARNLTIVSDD